MDLKAQAAKFSYRIEAKPEGGFRAIFADSGMGIIEGASREEVKEKVQAKLGEMIVAQLPTTFKIGGISVAVNTTFKVRTRTDASPTTGSEAHRSQSNTAIGSEATPIVPSANMSKTFRAIITVAGVAALTYFLLQLFHH